MDRELVTESLYRKYIEPTKKKRKEYIGIEIEMPVINLDKQAVDFDNVHAVTDEFIKEFGFKAVGRDDDGNIYSAASEKNGDILSYDCSYNNLELSFGREANLFAVLNRFNAYYLFLQNEFGRYNYTLTGMGVNPYRIYNRNIPIPNGRYRMLFHHLHSCKNYSLPMYFHQYPEYGTFSSASQVQLDVSYDKLTVTLNAFSKLEPIKALLFSNSVLLDEHEELICCRDMFWENSTHGINPHNVGMYDGEFSSADDILSYIKTTSIYCVERGEKYINFPPVNIMDYFERDSIKGEYFENGEYKTIIFTPKIEDINYLRTFKFEDLTFRGTIEFRSCCCQPIKDSMTVAAFHLGLIDVPEKLDGILSANRLYHSGFNSSELRRLFVKYDIPKFVDKDELYSLAKQVLDLSYYGLQKRGFGEESLLAPLYERVRLRTNPARNMLNLKKQGVPIEDIVRSYAEIGAAVVYR